MWILTDYYGLIETNNFSKPRILGGLMDVNGLEEILIWRRVWDSNPRWALTHTRVPGVRLQPLGQLSLVKLYQDFSLLKIVSKIISSSFAGALINSFLSSL